MAEGQVFYTAKGQRTLIVVIVAVMLVCESVAVGAAAKSGEWALVALLAITTAFSLWATFRTTIQCVRLNGDSLTYRGIFTTRAIPLVDIEHSRIAPSANAWSSGFAVELLFGPTSGRKPISLLPTAALKEDNARLVEIAGAIEAAILVAKRSRAA